MPLASQISALATRIATEIKTLSRTEVRIVGELISWPGTGTPPYGWLDADGSIKKKADWPELSTWCGTRFNTGFEAADEFRLPDWRGRVTVGLDATQTEFDAVNKAGGAKTHTLTNLEMPNHTHVKDGKPDGGMVPDGAYKGGIFNYGNGVTGAVTGHDGTTRPHNNLQPYRVARILIRAVTSVKMPQGSSSIDAAQIVSGTLDNARLPGRLQETSQPTAVTDWNNATKNGWYTGNGAANGPAASGWYDGTVVAHNSTYVTQTLSQFTDANFKSGADTVTYQRVMNGGLWGSWYRLRVSEAELDTRYARPLTKAGIVTVNFNASNEATVTYPGGAFPTTCLSVTVTQYGTYNQPYGPIGPFMVRGIGTSNCVVRGMVGNLNSVPLCIIAVGN